MNYFRCEKCSREFWNGSDKLFICPICKERDSVKRLSLDLGKPKVSEILQNPTILSKSTDQELLGSHKKFHRLFTVLRKMPHREVNSSVASIMEVASAHTILVDEMSKRKLPHVIKDTLDRSTKRVSNKKADVKSIELLQDWKDTTLVEDVVSVVGSSLYKDNPKDVDVVCKFTGVKVIEDAIRKVLEKKQLPVHIIHGKSHGEYVPKYDLVLREKPIEKKLAIKPPKYEYVHPLQYVEKTTDTEKFIVEPYIREAKRLLIIRKDGKVTIHLSEHKQLLNESFIKRIQLIEEPKDFILDGLLLKNGTIVLQDIIEKDQNNLKEDPLLSRKTFLIKTRIPRQANIAFIKFKLCKSKVELAQTLNDYKSKNRDAIIKPAYSKYASSSESAGWMRMNYAPLAKLDLGCGSRKAQGFVGLDKKSGVGVDVVCNLEKDIPFESNSCAEIRANHFVEHISNPQHIMEEIYRVLIHKGIVTITVPEASTKGAQKHLDHKSYWNDFSMDYYTEPYLIKKFQTKAYFKIKSFKKKSFFTGFTKRIHLTWTLEAIKKYES